MSFEKYRKRNNYFDALAILSNKQIEIIKMFGLYLTFYLVNLCKMQICTIKIF